MKVATKLGEGGAECRRERAQRVAVGDRGARVAAYSELMADETYTKCPFCGERIDPNEPGAVYAVEQVEVTTMGPTHQVIAGLGGYFRGACSPEAVGYAPWSPPTAPG